MSQKIPHRKDPVEDEKSSDNPDSPEMGYVRTKKIGTLLALKVVLVYITVGAILTIVFSDPVLGLFNVEPSFLFTLAPYKPLIYLVIMSPLLYWIIQRFVAILSLKNKSLEEETQKQKRLTRVQQISRELHYASKRIRDSELLLRECCKISQQKGEFVFVWASLSEKEGVLPQILVNTGQENRYLQDLFDGLHHQSAEERGEPALAALRKKQPVIINDVETYSKKPYAWQNRALQNGYRSIAAFPFKTLSGKVGVVAFYAKQTNIFSEEEIEILRDFVVDVGYGLSDMEQRQQFYHAANFDLLTNLPNRYLFEDRIKQAIARACHDERLVGIAVLEIAPLKKIVAQYGQAAGDKVLQETAKYLSSLVREGDTVARIGENQIGIMLADVAEINDIGIVIQQFVRQFIVNLTNFNEITVNLRAGISVFPQDSDNEQILIKNAEQTLNEIENRENINCDFYSKEMGSGIRNSQRIAQELQSALDNNEFFLYYQPIVNIESNEVIGVEALTRWRNAKLGEVSPVQFIGVAEESKLIMPLGQWIIKSACLQLMEWKKIGIKNKVMTVNVSAKQLMHPDFIENLRALFLEIKFNPREFLLGIEVTENTLMSDFINATKVLMSLREMGLKIYLDDFGTGNASLTYLHKLPVDVVKIDSMFIRTLGKDHNVKILIKGILALAQGLNLKVIAEGVETEKQLKLLQNLGCTEMQGYVFSPPLPAKNIEPLFQKPFEEIPAQQAGGFNS